MGPEVRAEGEPKPGKASGSGEGEKSEHQEAGPEDVETTPEGEVAEPEERTMSYSPSEGEGAMPEGEEAMSYSGLQALLSHPGGGQTCGGADSFRLEGHQGGADGLSVSPALAQLKVQVQSGDRKLTRAKAIIRSLGHNVDKRSLYKRKLAGLHVELRDQQSVFDTEIAALRAQLHELEKGKAKMVEAANKMNVKNIRLSQVIRHLHIDLGHLRAVNRQFAYRFAARPQY